MKKFLKVAGRIILYFMALILCAVMLANLALFGGIQWLNMPQGQSWLQQKTRQALAESGYRVTYDTVRYNANGLVLVNVKINDSAGVIAEIDRAALRLNILRLAARDISVALTANNVILHRLPAGTETTEPPKPLQPFAVPDMYFTSLSLDDLTIENLALDDAVLGQATALSLNLEADADLRNGLDLVMRGQLEPGENAPFWLSSTIAMKGKLDPRTLRASLAEFSVKSKDYALTMEGEAILGEKDMINLAATANISDLSLFVPGQSGNVHATALINGSIADPWLALTGRTHLETLRQRGVSEIMIELQAHDLLAKPTGHAVIKTAYQEMPLALTSDFIYGANTLSLTGLDLSGPGLSAGGNISLETGNLRATGMLEVQVKDIEPYAALFGRDISGSAKAGIRLSQGGNGTQAAKIELETTDIRYASYSARHVRLVTSVPDVMHLWPEALDLSLQGGRLGETLSLRTLSASLKDAGNAQYRLMVDGKGNFPQPFAVKGSADLTGLDDSKPAVDKIDFKIRSSRSSVGISGAIGPDAADLAFSTTDFALRSLPVSVPEALQGATVTGTARLTGPLDDPVATAHLVSKILQSGKKSPGLMLSADASYSGSLLTLHVKGSGTGIKRLAGQGTAPLSFSLRPFTFDFPSGKLLQGRLDFNLDGRVLSSAFLPPDHDFSGDISGFAAVNGIFDAPGLSGSLELDRGRYTYFPYEAGLRDIALRASLSRDAMTINRLSANDGGNGSLAGSGVIGLGGRATDVRIKASNLHLFRGGEIDGILSADLKAGSVGEGYAIKGIIVPGQFDIMIPDHFQTDIPELNIVQAQERDTEALKNIHLNIKVDAPRKIFVRGWGLDAEFGGGLDINGTLSQPKINGVLQSVRGRYEEFGKRFRLEKANLRFQGRVPPSPYLDIEAVTRAEDITASVLLTGPASKPGISFSSAPALPQDEILSRILFGRTLSRITPFQAIQLSQTLRRLSGKGGNGFDPLGTLRSATGLDDIRVDTDESGASSVGVGKYLTDKVYLEVEKGQGESSGAANIEIELTPSISLESELGQDAQGGAGIFWSRDY